MGQHNPKGGNKSSLLCRGLGNRSCRATRGATPCTTRQLGILSDQDVEGGAAVKRAPLVGLGTSLQVHSTGIDGCVACGVWCEWRVVRVGGVGVGKDNHKGADR